MANFGQQGDANLSCVTSTRTQRTSEEWKPKSIAGVVEFGRRAARLCDLFEFQKPSWPIPSGMTQCVT